MQRLLLLQRALENHFEARRIERLLDEIEDALAHGLDRRVDGPLPGDDHHRRVRLLLAQRADERQAVQLGHHQVADDHVGMRLGGQFQSAVAVRRLIDVVAPALEELREQLAGGLLVVDDQDAGLRHELLLPRMEERE